MRRQSVGSMRILPGALFGGVLREAGTVLVCALPLCFVGVSVLVWKQQTMLVGLVNFVWTGLALLDVWKCHFRHYG